MHLRDEPRGANVGHLDLIGADFDPATERAWIAAARRGEAAAVHELEQRLRCVPRFVERLNLRLGRRLDADDVLDVVQDVVLVALRNLERFHGRVPIEAWLHRICFLTLQNRLRARRIAPQSMGDAVEDLATAAMDADTELQAEVVQVLERIGGIEADILSMRHLEAMGFDEIAQRLGEGVATVKTRYYRALHRAQERMGLGARAHGQRVATNKEERDGS